MKILMMNRTDTEGGAARGATRLLEGIRRQNADVNLYVQRRTGNSPWVISHSPIWGKTAGYVRRALESILTGLSAGKTQGLFSPAFIPDRVSAPIAVFAPDIIHLHWVARMMRLETLGRFKMPIVWTLHDSWPFTGGCFLPFDCTRYREACGRCPILGSSREDDLSHWVWQRKRTTWQNLNLTLIAPSQWMAQRARASSLFRDRRVEVIPNGLDVSRYQPTNKDRARAHFSLPADKKLLLFGAKSATRDRNKGFHLLVQSLREIAAGKFGSEIELIVFGSSQPDPPQDLGLKAHYLGWQDDETALALLYAAADVFVLPSLQENLPYAIMEAMACGTPCVTFNLGGIPELIDHKQNGYLARPFEASDLTRGLMWVLGDPERRRTLSAGARRRVMQEFELAKVAERHLSLYRELLA
jgi:glycosyltransferase involved in cell wall biosynthesis